ncbi:SGNH/GDSL hydrolase family protein [Nitritalea halalkaliphila]|uniref:SGNH/GDSL hydrolase family protein n=1 Tax=Nitritalea halalkaliphila TaxID=590849 RepID=UPI00068022FB|nr:SGNH/GDSL hydrolase family protein [Nitritalea halalkaliphila]
MPVLWPLRRQGEALRKRVLRLKPQSEQLVLPGKDWRRVLVIGESTAAGVGASSAETTFAACLHRALDTGYGVVNVGKNGLRAVGLPTLYAKHRLEEERFTAIVLLIGANDCFRLSSPQRYYIHMMEFMQQLRAAHPQTPILLLDLPPVHLFPALAGVLARVMRVQRGLLRATTLKLLRFLPQARFIPYPEAFPPDFFASDGVHPSDAGYAAMAQVCAKQIKAL